MKYFLFLFCFLTTNAHAFLGCDRWGNFEVEGEWLYLRPSIDAAVASTAVVQAGLISSRILTNNPRRDSGWRVGASYQFCDCLYGLSVRWTQFKTQHSVSISGNQLVVPGQILGGNGSGTDRLRFSFHAFDGLLRRNLYCCECFNLDVIGGVQYAWTATKERVNYTAGANSLSAIQRSRFWGVGPEFGFDLWYRFWCNFALTGRGYGSLLVSRTHHDEATHLSLVIVEDLNKFLTDPNWRVVPAINIRFGLRYNFRCCCVNLFAEGGYEAIAYIHALPMISTTTINSFQRVWSNALMHGPYIAAGVRF